MLQKLTSLFGGLGQPSNKQTKKTQTNTHESATYTCVPIVPKPNGIGGNNTKETRDAVNAKLAPLEEARQARDIAETQKRQRINTNIKYTKL